MTPFWPSRVLQFACFTVFFGFRGGFLTRFGPDFGRTFDSTFASIFTLRGIGVLEGVHVLGEMSVLATPAADFALSERGVFEISSVRCSR